MVSIGGGGFGSLASTCRLTSSFDGSHLDPNGLVDLLNMEILEL